jgi:hypothetical protein
MMESCHTELHVEQIICNDELYSLTVSSMFNKIKDSMNKAIFAFIYVLNWKQSDVARILGVTEPIITRRIAQIQKDLWEFNPKNDRKVKIHDIWV